MRVVKIGLAVGVALAVGLVAFAAKSETIGSVDTAWRLTGNHSVQIERFDDPNIENVSCYVSYAKTGGLSGAIGFAENPSRFSIACRAIGTLPPIEQIDKSDREVFNRSSGFFKTMHVTRVYDDQKNVLVYLVWSDKLIDGSPFNSISVVPLQ